LRFVFSCWLESWPANPRRNGLLNMRQRLQEIGGRCEIQSRPGPGTQVTFFLPANEAAK